MSRRPEPTHRRPVRTGGLNGNESAGRAHVSSSVLGYLLIGFGLGEAGLGVQFST
jgi:hypothetical protein